MMKKKYFPLVLWIVAFLGTAAIFIFQRRTGPTQPIMARERLMGQTIAYRLLRSYTEFQPMPVKIRATNQEIKSFLSYRPYKTDRRWIEVEMKREGPILKGTIPGQAAAAKMEYTVRIEVEGQSALINKGNTIVTRFKGKVPKFFIWSHVVFMFLGILFAIRTGMESLRKNGNYFWMVNWTLGIVFIGGMILGPIVQEYAFGDFWTGFPFGYDLTDNKLLVAFIFWILAFFLKKKNKFWVLLATIMMLIVYFIPHSLLGSELDHETGKMKQKFGHAYKQEMISVSRDKLFTDSQLVQDKGINQSGSFMSLEPAGGSAMTCFHVDIK